MASNIQPTGLDWKNLPDKTTPISAENLNKMANTIDDLVTAVNPLNTVEANPEGTPTEGLEKVEIDGTLYEVKGGHKILNDSGTTLTQKDNLQFKGVYTQNNGDNTEVNICRTMTKAQMEALSGEELKGFINTSDEPDSLPLTAEWVAYDDNTSVKKKIDDVSKAITPSNVSLTLTSGNNLSINKIDVRRNGEIAIIFLRLQATASLSPNTEIEVGSFSGLNYIGHIGGSVVSNSDTSLVGGFAINASNKLYVNFNKTISTNTTILLTIPCFVVTS